MAVGCCLVNVLFTSCCLDSDQFLENFTVNAELGMMAETAGAS